MTIRYPPPGLVRLNPSFVLLGILLGVLWLTGGASRADVLGQVVSRAAAWVVLILAIVLGAKPSLREYRATLLLLLAVIALPLLQMIPLPPSLWQNLPGRAQLTEAAVVIGQSQPWRPLAIVPGAAENAAASLVVPLTVFVLVASLTERERSWLPGLLLILIATCTLVGLLQFSGFGFNNIFANDTPGQVSGTFANRNHFALFLAFGCMLAPVWAFLDGREPQWRGPAALGLVLLFALTILASGSRTGLVLGVLGGGLGLLLVREGVRNALRRYPRWAFPALIAGIVGLMALFVLISVAAGRAVSINRVFELDAAQDMRARALPTVVAMIRTYFPFGSGLGGFDPIYRIHEPFDLLNLTYHNHAHNDFLEIVLDAGLAGFVLLLSALLWWTWRSARVWRSRPGPRHALPRLGSAMLLLVFIASIFDYPARTPMIMAMIVVAGVWLGERVQVYRGSALPRSGQPL
jgi:O-antigen ligase